MYYQEVSLILNPIQMKKFIFFGFVLLFSMALQAEENYDSIKVLLQKGQIEKDAGRNKLALE